MIAQITWMHFGLMLWICAAIFLLRWVANGAVLFSLIFWIHGCLVLLFGSFILFFRPIYHGKTGKTFDSFERKVYHYKRGMYNRTTILACAVKFKPQHAFVFLYKPLPQPVITYQALLFHEAACVYDFAVLTLSEIVWELLVTSHVCFFFVLFVF